MGKLDKCCVTGVSNLHQNVIVEAQYRQSNILLKNVQEDYSAKAWATSKRPHQKQFSVSQTWTSKFKIFKYTKTIQDGEDNTPIAPLKTATASAQEGFNSKHCFGVKKKKKDLKLLFKIIKFIRL